MVPHQRERLKHLASEASDKSSGKAHETVRLDEFVQVDAQQLHGDTKVVAEVEVFRHLDNMVLLFLILKGLSALIEVCDQYPTYPFAQTVQDLDLHKSLVMEPLLIPNNLDGYGLASAMVAAVQHLSERPLA